MRMPVWDKPRVIGCAENYPLHVALPRGCLEPAMDLLKANHIEAQVHDERSSGTAIEVAFTGTLRTDQEAAAAAIVKHDVGILSAPTAFGKTVIAAATIARRGVSTLVIVHRTELLKQWRARLAMFLDVDAKSIGAIGAGKFKPTGVIDIAVLQSLSRKEDVGDSLPQSSQASLDAGLPESHAVRATLAGGAATRRRLTPGAMHSDVRRQGHCATRTPAVVVIACIRTINNRFTAADLTFAALASPVLLPERGIAAYPVVDELPVTMREHVERLRDTQAGRFALRMYAQERWRRTADAA